MNSAQRTCLIGIVAILVVIAMVVVLSKMNGNQITGAYQVYEPTYCFYESGVTDLECACGKAAVSKASQIVSFHSLRGRQVSLAGDWCLLQHQRDLCGNICKYSAATLTNFGSAPGPTGGRVEIISVSGMARPNYYRGHTNRARAGAYSYITNK